MRTILIGFWHARSFEFNVPSNSVDTLFVAVLIALYGALQRLARGKTSGKQPVRLVTPKTDPVVPSHKTYDYLALVPLIVLCDANVGLALFGH